MIQAAKLVLILLFSCIIGSSYIRTTDELKLSDGSVVDMTDKVNFCTKKFCVQNYEKTTTLEDSLQKLTTELTQYKSRYLVRIQDFLIDYYKQVLMFTLSFGLARFIYINYIDHQTTEPPYICN